MSRQGPASGDVTGTPASAVAGVPLGAPPAAAHEPVEPQAFRRAMGRFPTGVAIVTALDVTGQPQAMTVSSLTSVSLEPCLLLVCLDEDSRVHEAATAAGRFGVSLLGVDDRATSVWLATPGRPSLGQLDRVPHRRGPVTGVPLLDGALATMECAVEAVHPAGDHGIVVGAVLDVAFGPAEREPLVWFRSGYRQLAR